MRIALVNNNNNIFFSIARFLRDRGHDVTLLMMDYEYVEAPHFHPSCDTFDLEYQKYCRVVDWGMVKAFATYDMAKVEKDLAPFDFVIGSGSTPAFMARIGRPLDVFIPWGADLCEDPFKLAPFNRRSLRSLLEYPYWQRRGVRETRCVFGDVSPVIDPQLEQLGYRNERVIASAPMPYSNLYDPATFDQYAGRTCWFPYVKALRDRVDVLIHAPARHVWCSTLKYNWTKGNDKLIRAVADLKKRAPHKRVGIVFYQYGPDVAASQALVEELGITDDVLWLPLSHRKDVMVNLSVCDFSCGELGETSWYTGGTILEALCMGKPLLNRREDSAFEKHYEEMYPMINVRTAEDIASVVEDSFVDPGKYRELGRKSRVWFEEHVARRSLAALENLIAHGATHRK